jgi:hypothetical protein
MPTRQQSTGRYSQQARHMSYIRWKAREGKAVTTQEQRDLDRYDAKHVGADPKALAKLRNMGSSGVKRASAQSLQRLAVQAGLVADGENITRKQLTARCTAFIEGHLRAARSA